MLCLSASVDPPAARSEATPAGRCGARASLDEAKKAAAAEKAEDAEEEAEEEEGEDEEEEEQDEEQDEEEAEEEAKGETEWEAENEDDEEQEQPAPAGQIVVRKRRRPSKLGLIVTRVGSITEWTI